MRQFLTIGGLLLFGILVIFMLYIQSKYLNLDKNNFTRMYPGHPIEHGNILDLKYDSYYIAGGSKTHIYLGNRVSPVHLIKASLNLSDTQHLRISVSDTIMVRSKPNLAVIPPHFFLMEGNTPLILGGSLAELKAKTLTSDTSIFFVDSQPLSPSSFILKLHDQELERYVLIKFMGDSLEKKSPLNILEKQIDGFFCTDGMLRYDPQTARLMYVYYYRNQYINIDSNLIVQYRGRTIDTVSQAKIKIDTLENGQRVTMSAPPLVVNKNSCVSGDLLFIHSGLMADNEDRKSFENSAVIDVYSLESKSYKFSFNISNFRNKKLGSFKVFNKTLFAMNGRYIQAYKLKF